MTDITIYALLVAMGLAAGFLSGTIGIGGGLIIIPALIFFLGLTQKEAQGTSLAFMIPPIGIFAAINYSKQGLVHWKYALFLSLFFTIGAFFGSKFALSIDGKVLKKVFGFLLLFVAAKMIFSK